MERHGRVQGRGGGPAPLRRGMAADSREVPRRCAEGVHQEERRAPVRARARDRRRRDRVPARAVEGGRADPLEPRLHGPRPPDVARLGGLLRRPRGRDHVLPRLGGVRARLPRRHQGRRRHAGVQDDRGPREAQPRLLGGDRVRGRERRADGRPARRDHQDLPVLRQHGRHVRQGGGERDDEEDDRADLRQLLPGAHESARPLGHVLRDAGPVPLARGLGLPDGLHAPLVQAERGGSGRGSGP